MSLILKNVKEHLFVDVETKDLKKEKLPPKPTYKQFKAYNEANHGFKVTPLYLAQVKDEFGLGKQYSFEGGGMACRHPANRLKSSRRGSSSVPVQL
jgi:23S rRNA (uracil1939-C5)-methyltransferase